MKKTISEVTLTYVLSRLMADKKLKVRDLVKITGLPQTTISNILLGKSKCPRPETLKTLANVFNISTAQLLGYEALESPSSVTASSKIKSPSSTLVPVTIPLIQWNEVKPWILNERGIRSSSIWISNDSSCKNPKAFALEAKPSMRSHFFSSTKNAILLIDPDNEIEDGGVLLVFLDDSKEPSLRLLAVDGKDKWLRGLEEKPVTVKLSQQHFVVGAVVEARLKLGIK